MKEERKVIVKKEEDKKAIIEEDAIKDLNIRVSMITKDIRIRQNIPDNIKGLLITKVEQNSDAERKGIRPGDIIQEVNQTPINSIEELKGIIKIIKGKKKGVLLLVNRQGNINFVALKLN